MGFLCLFESSVILFFKFNRNNKLSVIPACICGMKSLKELDLSGNFIENVQELESLEKLTKLFLNKNKISDIGKILM